MMLQTSVLGSLMQAFATETASSSLSEDTWSSASTRDATERSSMMQPSLWAMLNNFADLNNSMDEILLLQQQLMAVQNSSTLYKLANRNVIEIVELLTKKYGLELYFTLDGREFITPEYLDSMIKEVVNENGKIRLDELSNLLNVSTGVVERRLEELVKKKQLSNVSGTYISPTYIDRLAEQISDELQATNELKIVDVSLKFELPFDFLQSELSARVGKQINGQLSGDGKSLYTAGHLGLVKARLKGIFRCQAIPKMLSSVSKTYKIDQNTLETDLKSLIDSGELNGAVKSGFYIPNKFLEMKDELVAKTFEDQGFIDYSWIENNFLEKKPKDLIKRLVGGDVIYLKSTALSKKKIEDLREKVAQNLETEGYAESTQIFPSTFDDEDISTLLEEHLGVAGLIVEEHTLILETFIQKCVNKLKENMVQIIEDAENEALQALKPGEKKKKGKSGADKFPLSQNDISKVLQEKKVMEYIVDESQREAFFKHLVPRLDAEYLKLKEEMQNKKVAASSDVVADLSAKVEHLGMTLLLTNRTIKNMLESMPEFDSGAAEAMALSIVRPLVERIVFLNLKRFKIHVEPVNLYKKKAEEVVSSEFDKLSTPVFAEGLALESLIEKVPKDTREILKEMFTRMSDNNLPKFCAFLEEKGPDIGAPKFNINKKTEKAHTLAFKFFAEDHFKNEENLTKKVCLFFSLIGMGEGLYFWPFLPGKSQRIPLNTIYSALITIKEKFGEKYWPEIETLFKLANRDPQSREDFNEAKPHFKNLQKLA